MFTFKNFKVTNLSNYNLFTRTDIIDGTFVMTVIDNDARLKIPRESMVYIKKNLPGHLIGAEVGTNDGSHALQISNYLNCKLFAIDLWEDYKEANFLNEEPTLNTVVTTKRLVELRLKGLDIVVIRGDSTEEAGKFADKYFDFVYIDANHTYEKVKEDIIAWKPKVKIGGVLCGHDYCPECEGVMKAVDELLPDAVSTYKIRYPDWYWRIK